MEVEEFKDSDHHKGYFCYNCVYFVKPHHCAIVTDEGMDILARSSWVIAPHGLFHYGCQIIKRHMVILLIEGLVQEPLSKVSLRNQLLVYLLAFHAKYVTSPLHLEENSDSIQ
jgi:hypothetical protein